MDLIAASAAKDEIANVLAQFRERLSGDFGPRLKSLTFHDIAARDPTNQFAPGHGLGTLINDWATPHLRYISLARPPLALRGEFDRLLARTPMEFPA
jgi:hypothetical protein